MPLRNYLVEVDARAWPRYARMAQAGAAGWWANGRTRLSVDAARTYRVRARARRGGGADGTFYAGVALFDASGVNIPGDGAQWFYAASGVTPGSSWTEYTGLFGAGTGKTFPVGAVTMTPLFILNYASTTGYTDCRSVWIEDVTGGDVVISADPHLFDPSEWRLLTGAAGNWFTEVGSADVVTRTLRFSTHGYMTAPTDSPPNTAYPARVLSPGLLRQELPEGLFGVASVSYGEIVLDNSDGALSEITQYGFGGAPVRVKWYDAAVTGTPAISSLLTAAADRLAADDRRLRLRLRSPDAALDKPHCGRYAGTGGAEGGSSMAGVRKPALFGGQLNQIEPVCVDDVTHVYQVSAEAVTVAPSTTTVAVAGAAVTNQTPTYATLADLLATAPTVGQARWYWGSEGLWVRINRTIDGVVTCNVIGPSWDNARPWDMVRKVALAAGLTAGEMEQAAGWDLPQPDNWDGGLFWPSFSPRPCTWLADDTTSRELAHRMCQQAGAWAGYIGWSSLFGTPKWGMSTMPSRAALGATEAAERLFDETSISRVRPVQPPSWDRVLHRVTLRTNQNVRPLLPVEVPTGWTASLGRDWALSYSASDSAVLGLHPTAGESAREWTSASQSTAVAEATRRLKLFRYARQWFEVVLPIDAVDHPVRTWRPALGQFVRLSWPTLQVTEADGTSASEGWFLVCAAEIDLAAGEVRLTVREAHLVN